MGGRWHRQRVGDTAGIFPSCVAGTGGRSANQRPHYAGRRARNRMARFGLYWWRCRYSRSSDAVVARTIFMELIAAGLARPGRILIGKCGGTVATDTSGRELAGVAAWTFIDSVAGRTPGGFGSANQHAAAIGKDGARLGRFAAVA